MLPWAITIRHTERLASAFLWPEGCPVRSKPGEVFHQVGNALVNQGQHKGSTLLAVDAFQKVAQGVESGIQSDVRRAAESVNGVQNCQPWKGQRMPKTSFLRVS